MEKLEPTTPLRDLTRGGQTFMHSLRMFMQVFRYAFFSAFLLFLFLVAILTQFRTTQHNRYLFYEYLEAQIKVLFNDSAHTLIKNPKGVLPTEVNLLSIQFVKEPTTQYHVTRCLNGFVWALQWSAILSLSGFSLLD